MREIKFDFNNIGGLAEIYAIPPSDFLRLRHDYNNDTESHPTWVRGLKLADEDATLRVLVAPYVSAWIETFYI